MVKSTLYSERVVVDELFDDGTVRLLRARRFARARAGDLSLSTWASETEYVMAAWRLEAFVGYPANRQLKEGDVFFLRDGRELRSTYHPEKAGIRRIDASRKHLLVSWDESRDMARRDIKEEFRILHMKQANQKAFKPKELESSVAKAIDSRRQAQGGRP